MVSLVRPLSGRVVSQHWAERVVSPLHDVLSMTERRDMLAAYRDSYLHVTSDPQDQLANLAALRRLLGLGAYDVVEDALFVYRMASGGSDHTGVVALTAVSGFVDGQVLGHEAVQGDRVDGLVRHFDAVPLRSELVSLVHRSDPAVADLVARTCAEPPLLDFADVSGVRQTVWRVGREEAAALTERLGDLPLYIADGHHRVAASVRRWERDGRPGSAAVLCAIYPEDQIQLFAFHRRVRGPVCADELVESVTGRFAVRRVDGPTQVKGSLGVYVDGGWLRLDSGAPRADGVAGLDVTTLDEQVLRPALGLTRDDPRLEFVQELRDLRESLQVCDIDGGALFTLCAPGMDDLVAVAERGEVMSAKSTYVQPKPRTGIFLV
jgi:uncharacterized protein (DUF1015 family)